MKKLSLIIPCYNEEETIQIFVNEINKVKKELVDLQLEWIFVDDGSTDRTLEILKELHTIDRAIHYISFSRNFGKEAAIFAGLEKSTGDYIVIMDVDLQDPPSLLPTMYASICEGFDCVATRRATRDGEPKIRSAFARLFYLLMKKISKTEIVDGARDYRFITRKVANAILEMKEYNRFIKGIYGWVGFKTKWLEYDNIERCAGNTKWSFKNLFLYSVEGILAFTTLPLTIISIIGVGFCFISFFMLIFIFGRAVIYGDSVAGWPSLVCIITFFGGIQLMCMGVIGLYLSKTYLETKKRPLYLVQEQE